MLLSLSVHEYAHAVAAYALGDRTAQEQGRLTLNPLSHIDLIGTVLLPIYLIATMNGRIFFGWAKPVPYDPRRFTRRIDRRQGTMLVAAAGPASNLLLAFLITSALGLMIRFGVALKMESAWTQLASSMISINVGLAIFNLLPLGPLDGAKVLCGLLPAEWAYRFEQISERYSFLAMLLLLFIGSRLVSGPIITILNVLFNKWMPLLAGGAI